MRRFHRLASSTIGPSMSKGALALRRWRLENAVRQSRLGVMLDYDNITRIERGTHRPSLRLANRIMELTGIATAQWEEPATADDLVALDEAFYPPPEPDEGSTASVA